MKPPCSPMAASPAREARPASQQPARSTTGSSENAGASLPGRFRIEPRCILIGVLLVTSITQFATTALVACQLDVTLPTVETMYGPFENRFDGHAVLEGDCFGASPGRVVVTVPPHEADENGEDGFRMVHDNLPSEAWSNERIELNLYHNPSLNDRLDSVGPDDQRRPFNFHLFDTPIKIEVFQNGNTTDTANAETFFPFPDIAYDHWAGRYIVRLWKRGVVDGQGDLANLGQYGSGLDVTRAEFVKIMMLAKRSVDGPLSRVRGPLESSYCDLATEVFDDVADHWSCDYVGLVVQAGHELGWEPDYEGRRLFRPDLPLTRAGAARYAALLSTREGGEPKSFSDLAGASRSGSCSTNTAPPFADCVDEASARKIVGGLAGTDTFAPNATLNRAEAAKIAAESFDILGPFLARLDGRAGCGHCGKGKVVILIHGLFSGPEAWTWSHLEDPTGQSMEVGLMDLDFVPSISHDSSTVWEVAENAQNPSFRHSLFIIRLSSSTELTLAQQAEELGEYINAIIETENPAEIMLVGHSMGGLAARALLQFPLSLGSNGNGSIKWSSATYRSVVSRLVTLNTPHQGSPWPAIVQALPWNEILGTVGQIGGECFSSPLDESPCSHLCSDRSFIEAKLAPLRSSRALQLLASERLSEPGSELALLRSSVGEWSSLGRVDPVYIATWEDLSAEIFINYASSHFSEFWGFLAEHWVGRECWEERIIPILTSRMSCSNDDLVVCHRSQVDILSPAVYDRKVEIVFPQWHGSTRNADVITLVKQYIGWQKD